jgi:ribosomal protein L18
VKPKIDQPFANFRIFMQKEYGKHQTQNKTTAKAVGYGIANTLNDKTDEQMDHLEAQALMIAELANSMQEES